MFQRSFFLSMFAALIIVSVVQQRGLYAQTLGVEVLGSRLNRDSFQLCREIRTRFRGIRGQRVFFAKAHEIHEMADDIQRMIILKAPVQGMDQALCDLNLLVENLDRSLKSTRLPVLTDPVIKPTGPNGYIFYGGNGYPQPCFRCEGFPYQMIPEQGLKQIHVTLQQMKSSISQLQAHYAPPVTVPEKRTFPVPVPRSDSDLRPAAPFRKSVPLSPEKDSGWKPSRKTAPVFPPAPKQKSNPPVLEGPQFLPPLPPNE